MKKFYHHLWMQQCDWKLWQRDATSFPGFSQLSLYPSAGIGRREPCEWGWERCIFFYWGIVLKIVDTHFSNCSRKCSQAYYSSMNRCLALLFMIIGCDLQGRLAFLSTGVFLCKVWQIHLINTWMEWAAFSIPKHLFSLYVFFPNKGVCMFCLPREGLRGISPFVLYINTTSFSPLTYNYVVVQ